MNHGTHIQAWALGFAVATGIAVIARVAGALDTGGAVAAAMLGTLAVAAGWSWGTVLIAYFTSAVLLSRFRFADKQRLLSGRVEKDGPRDAVQVIANGGVFGAMALAYVVDPGPMWQALAAGALSASAADTWATEIGVLSRANPWSVLTWSPVTRGTSGGVTLQGLLGGVAGAAFIAAIVLVVRWPASAAVAALVGGVFGCLLDSVVGASSQARRWCVSCATTTEQRIHRCGSATSVTGGLSWLDNDGVNAVATLGGALVGGTVARFF